MTMRYNIATGQMEDDQLDVPGVVVAPKNDQMDPRMSAQANKAVLSRLEPGQFVAGGGASAGVFTNAPSALDSGSVRGWKAGPVVPNDAQQAMAAVQAKAAQATADEMVHVQNGGPAQADLQQTVKELTPQTESPVAKGQAKPYSVNGASNDIIGLAGKQTLAYSSGNTAGLDPSDPSFAIVEKKMREQGHGGLVDAMKKKRAELAVTINKLSEDNPDKFMTRDEWNAFVSENVSVPKVMESFVQNYAKTKLPESVRAREAGVNLGIAEAAKIEGISGAKLAEDQKLFEQRLEQKKTEFRANQSMADEGNATLVANWAAGGLPKSTPEERAQFSAYVTSGKTDGLDEGTIEYYKEKAAEYRRDATTEWAVGPSGAAQKDIGPAERQARMFEYKRSSRAPYMNQDGSEGPGLFISKVKAMDAKTPEEIRLKNEAAKIESDITEQGKLIKVSDRAIKAIVMTTGVDQSYGYDVADKVYGVKPGTPIKPGTALDGSKADADIKAVKYVIDTAIENGRSIEDKDTMKRLADTMKSEKDSDAARTRLGNAVSSVMLQYRNDSMAEWNKAAEVYSETLVGQASSIAMSKLQKMIGKNPMQQAQEVEQLINATIPAALASGRIKLDFDTEQGRSEATASPWIALNAILAQMQQDGKTDPSAMVFMNQALAGGTTKETWPAWAAQNKTLARSAEQMMASLTSGKMILSDKVAESFDDAWGLKGSGAFKQLQSSGVTFLLKDGAKPESAIAFTNSGLKTAYEKLPEEDREQFLLMLPSKYPRLYGSGLGNDKPMTSNVHADALVASVNDDKIWMVKNGFMSEGEGGGTFELRRRAAIAEQMAPIVDSKHPQGIERPPSMPNTFLSKPENMKYVSGNTTAMWDRGTILARSKDAATQVIGQRMQNAAIYAGLLEERGQLTTDVGVIAQKMQIELNRIIVDAGIAPIMHNGTIDVVRNAKVIENAMSAASVGSVDDVIKRRVQYAAANARNLRDSLGELKKNAAIAADRNTLILIDRYSKSAQSIIDAEQRMLRNTTVHKSWLGDMN